MMYTKIDSCSPEILRNLNTDNIFFRFHDPKRRISSRSKSWGMIYSSAAEAIRDGSTILNGKSCADSPEKLMEWAGEFDNSYVVIAFAGVDTREVGHDGETVAEYHKKIAAFNFKDFCNCFTCKELEPGVSGWVLN